MRKVMKKIVASLATVAMAAGLFATMPAQEAKAAATTNAPSGVELYVKGSFDKWESLNKMEKNGDVYTYTYNVTKAGKYEYMFTNGSNWGDEGYCQIQNGDGNNFEVTASGAGTVTITVDVSKGTWEKTVEEKDKWGKDNPKNDAVKYKASGDAVKAEAKITKSAYEVTAELIEKALGKEVTLENKATYDEAMKSYNELKADEKSKVDSSKLAKLEAAITKLAELQAAEDAKFAGKLTIYVNVKATGWNKVCLYSWDRDDTKYFGAWPGNELTPLKKNVGWYSCSFDITREARVIFNNGQGNGSNQTVDWTGVKAGTYWITLSEKADNGNYKVDAVSTKAPSDWKDEAAQEVETQETTTAQQTTAAPVDKGDVVSKDEAAKFEKEAVVEGQPEGAAFKVTEIAADSDAFKAVKEVAKTDLKNRTYVAVDFKLLKGTEAVQPNGDVKITMPVPEKLKNAKQVEVFRMGDDGKLVKLGKADVTDSKITFTTNHFSTYVFAEVKTATGTGDVAPIIALLAVAAVAGAMVVASRKKTVNE